LDNNSAWVSTSRAKSHALSSSLVEYLFVNNGSFNRRLSFSSDLGLDVSYKPLALFRVGDVNETVKKVF